VLPDWLFSRFALAAHKSGPGSRATCLRFSRRTADVGTTFLADAMSTSKLLVPQHVQAPDKVPPPLRLNKEPARVPQQSVSSSDCSSCSDTVAPQTNIAFHKPGRQSFALRFARKILEHWHLGCMQLHRSATSNAVLSIFTFHLHLQVPRRPFTFPPPPPLPWRPDHITPRRLQPSTVKTRWRPPTARPSRSFCPSS
jgi:hypothetical protein